jgi:hypothetical protein
MNSRSSFPWIAAALLPWILCAAAPVWTQAITDCGQGCSPTPFACGGEIAGELSPSDCKEGARFVDVHEWNPTSAVEAEIRIRAVGFTPRLLILVKVDGFQCFTVAESTPCEPAEPGTACLRARIFPGKLLLVVTSEEDGATGTYAVRSSCGPFRCDPACRRGSIACGATVSGNLAPGAGCDAASGGAFASWDFDVPSRTKVRISATSASPLLASIHYPDFFTGRDCLELAAPRLCAPGSCIDLILEPGALHISIAALAPGGTYDLTVTCEEFDACAGCPIVGSVRCGSDVAGRLGPEDCEAAGTGEDGGYRAREERWTFDVTEAGLYKVSADAAEGFVSARVVLRDGCGSIFVPVDPCPARPRTAAPSSISSRALTS